MEHLQTLKAGPFRPVLLLWSSEGSLLVPVFVGYYEVVGPAGFEPATKGL